MTGMMMGVGDWPTVAPGGGGNTPGYFGECDPTTGAILARDNAANSDSTLTMWEKFTCPGTGARTVSAMAGMLNSSSGSGKVRYAIYDALGTTLIAQSATMTLTNVESWQETAISASLTGGTDYFLCVTADNPGMETLHANSSTFFAPAANFAFTDYTVAGYPSSLPSGFEGNGSLIFLYPLRATIT